MFQKFTKAEKVEAIKKDDLVVQAGKKPKLASVKPLGQPRSH